MKISFFKAKAKQERDYESETDNLFEADMSTYIRYCSCSVLHIARAFF